MSAENLQYTELQTAAGFFLGQKVRIARKITDEERKTSGWTPDWVNSMDETIGEEGIITEISAYDGIRVQMDDGVNDWWYPYFVLGKVEMTPDQYKEAEIKWGFKKEDWVRIVRKAESYEGGWQNPWIDQMDRNVGKVGQITTESDAGASGLDIYIPGNSDTYRYPYFSLEKYPTDEEEYLKIHKSSEIKKGDMVKIVQSLDSLPESGWREHWIPEKDKWVGKIVLVIADHLQKGFYLKDESSSEQLHFPYYILQKIPNKDVVSSGVSSETDTGHENDSEVEFRKKMKESPITVGDYVTITKKAKPHEGGWGTGWSSQMNEFINKIGIVSDVSYGNGFHISVSGLGSYWFPWFVVAPVEESQLSPEKLFKMKMKKSGIEEGDYVKITGKAEHGEQGWQSPWGSEAMDAWVDHVGVVTSIDSDTGFRVSGGAFFPWFVVEKIPVNATKANYIKNKETSGFKVGDYVKIVRRSVAGDQGWQGEWSSFKSLTVGDTERIEQDLEEDGFLLSNGKPYPYTSLDQSTEKVSSSSLRLEFTKAMEKSPLEDADIVKVTRIAKNKENGWGGNWRSETMDSLVGKEGIVVSNDGVSGFIVSFPESGYQFYLPYFVLELSKKGISEAKYDAMFKQGMDESPIKVGSIVKLIAKATSKEKGWTGSWDDSLDDMIGQTFIVVEKRKNNWGFVIEGNSEYKYFVPYYVIEKDDTAELPPKLAFRKAMSETPIKIGDVVRITYKASPREKGWEMSEFPADMEIGEEYQVNDVSRKYGFSLFSWKDDSTKDVPYFSVEKVENPKPLPLSPKQIFAKKVKDSGIEVGDVVLVTKKLLNVKGWEEQWYPAMDDSVGKEFKVNDLSKEYGIQVQADKDEYSDDTEFYWYPPQVLKKLNKTEPFRKPFNPFEGDPMFTESTSLEEILQSRHTKKMIEEETNNMLKEAIRLTENQKLDEVDTQHTFGFDEPEIVKIPFYKSDIETWDKIPENDRNDWVEEIGKKLSHLVANETYPPDEDYYDYAIDQFTEGYAYDHVVKEILNDLGVDNAFKTKFNDSIDDYKHQAEEFLDEHKEEILDCTMKVFIDNHPYGWLSIQNDVDDSYGDGMDPIEIPDELAVQVASIPDSGDIDLELPSYVYSAEISDEGDSISVSYAGVDYYVCMRISEIIDVFSNNDFMEGKTAEPKKSYSKPQHQEPEEPEEPEEQINPFEGDEMFTEGKQR